LKELHIYFKTFIFEFLEKSFTEKLKSQHIAFSAKTFKTNLNIFIHSSKLFNSEVHLFLKKVPNFYSKHYFAAREQQKFEDLDHIKSKLNAYLFQLPEVQEYLAFTQDYLYLHRDEFLKEMKFAKDYFRGYLFLERHLKDKCLAALDNWRFPAQEFEDRRIYFETSPSVRYLTYFALLLRLPHSLSMCTAVTIADVSSISKSLSAKQRLLVACNLSSDQIESIAILRDMLSKKIFKLNLIFQAILFFKQHYTNFHLNIIEQLLQHLEENYPLVSSEVVEEKDGSFLLEEKMVKMGAEYRVGAISPMAGHTGQPSLKKTGVFQPITEIVTDESCVPVAQFLLSYLAGQQKTFSKNHLLLCATAKVIYAVCFDEQNKIFSEEKKQAFFNLDSALLLLPALKSVSLGCMNIMADVHTLGLKYHCSTYNMVSITGERFINRVKINHVHAEQLLAYFVETILGIQLDSKLIGVGVSMLCCQTCMAYLRAKNIPFYGTHSKIFPDVVNFLEHTLESPAKSSLFKAISHPAVSPFVSRRYHF
jgi:hypothetical protein